MGYIYQIRNVENDKVYIGSTVNRAERKTRHIYQLRKGVHDNLYLQRAFSINPNSFRFETLQQVPDDRLLECERDELDTYKVNGQFDRERCYNLAIDPFRHKFSAETRKKWSEMRTGKGNPFYGKHHSEEAKVLIKLANNLWERTSEYRLKISATSKGRVQSPEQIEKRVASHRGAKRSPEARQRMSEASIKRHEEAKRRKGESSRL